VRNLTLGETDSNFSPNKQNLFGQLNSEFRPHENSL